MNITGKLIGAILGLILLRHPLGFVLGLILGHLFDSGLLRLGMPGSVKQRSFLEPLFAFIGALSKADGHVSEQEVAATEALMARMWLNAQQRQTAIDRFNEGKQPNFPVHLCIADLKAWCGERRDLAFLLLDMLLEIVYAEGPLTPPKFALLRKLTWTLGVSDYELDILITMKGYDNPSQTQNTSSEPSDPYNVLGITPQATPQEIKRAYRLLISRFHPDKLGDAPEKYKRRAEEQAREINAAYERLKSERRNRPLSRPR